MKIGEKYITKEWECAEEWEKKYGNRNLKEDLNATFNEQYNYIGHKSSSANRSASFRQAEENLDDSVEADPTFRNVRDDIDQTSSYHDGCDL